MAKISISYDTEKNVCMATVNGVMVDFTGIDFMADSNYWGENKPHSRFAYWLNTKNPNTGMVEKHLFVVESPMPSDASVDEVEASKIVDVGGEKIPVFISAVETIKDSVTKFIEKAKLLNRRQKKSKKA